MARSKNRRRVKQSKGWEPCALRPWTEDMVIKYDDSGGITSYHESYITKKLKWVSRRDPTLVRIPRQETKTFRMDKSFTAAGRGYKGLWQLRDKKVPDVFHWYEDIYGREVFCVFKRSNADWDYFDRIYDTRCRRWYLLRDGEKLTQIYHVDGSSDIIVTEDVRGLEYDIWQEMVKYGYFNRIPETEKGDSNYGKENGQSKSKI